MSVKKNTFIDQIIHNNSRKAYPLPGPGSAFNDKITAKKLYKENRDLVVCKEREAKKKNNLPKEKRNFILSNQEKYNKNFPAPNKYLPVVP